MRVFVYAADRERHTLQQLLRDIQKEPCAGLAVGTLKNMYLPRPDKGGLPLNEGDRFLFNKTDAATAGAQANLDAIVVVKMISRMIFKREIIRQQPESLVYEL